MDTEKEDWGQRLRRAARTLIPGAREVAHPTYTSDIVGEIERWDERDILFARKDFFRYFSPESEQYRRYYAEHPNFLAYDTRIGKMAGLGRTGGIDEPMFDAQFEITAKMGVEHFVDGDPAAEKAALTPERAAQKVKALARFLGAAQVKIGPLRPSWVYTHVGRSRGDAEGYPAWGTPISLSHPHAIAMAFPMNQPLARTAPDFPTLLATAKGYGLGAWVSVQLAAYIRGVGYAARAHHLNNYQVIAVPVAVDCGLGELSRAGYLITKELGLALRLAIVTTDLPLAHDAPIDIGVQSFCEQCERCAEACPIGAIPFGEKTVHNGVRKWKLDAEKCYRYWHAVGSDCGICMNVCPWSRPRNWFHSLMSRLATVKGPHQRWMAWADRFFYGAYKPRSRPAFIDERAPAHQGRQ
jgi:ferredoxin